MSQKYAVDSRGYQLGSGDILPHFSFKSKGTIPPNFSAQVEIQGFVFKCFSKHSERRRHRIFTTCSRCKQDIPAGRIQQHIGKQTCA